MLLQAAPVRPQPARALKRKGNTIAYLNLDSKITVLSLYPRDFNGEMSLVLTAMLAKDYLKKYANIREAYSGYYDKSRDTALDVELTDAAHYKRVPRRVGHPPNSQHSQNKHKAIVQNNG